MTQLPVTVVVPVKNEEKNLPGCLARLGGFAEILVVDSDSTDRTREITERAGAKLLDFDWPGGFPKKRNWVLMTYTFSTKWVLFLDADEYITKAFVEELRDSTSGGKCDGYWLN